MGITRYTTRLARHTVSIYQSIESIELSITIYILSISRGLVLCREAEGREAHALDEHARGGEGVELCVVLDGEASALRDNEDVKEFYLGVSGENRRSFKNVKAYKRRKRWLA